uniref:Uncharacterized protein n=1 Tax=Caenorhabditis japonica TaxID=281687 RepID=A0A8R1J240_CAEJA
MGTYYYAKINLSDLAFAVWICYGKAPQKQRLVVLEVCFFYSLNTIDITRSSKSYYTIDYAESFCDI